MASVNCKFS